MHLFQSGGFYIKTNPPLGRPIFSPAPESPGGGGWFTPRLPPITHCSSPRVRGTGTRDAGARTPSESRAPSAPGPGVDVSPFRCSPRGRPTWIFTTSRRLGPGRPGGAGAGAGARASRSGRRRSPAGREGGKKGGHLSEGRGPARGRAGLTAEGAAPAAVPRRALARRCPSGAPPGSQPGRSARSLAAALTHIPSIPEEPLGRAGAGARAPPRGAAESSPPGRGAHGGGLRTAFYLEAAVSKHLVPIFCPRRLFPGNPLQKLPSTPG